jgi:sulfate adenylyltransferase subunit 1 (EFTu-like GTPase family)
MSSLRILSQKINRTSKIKIRVKIDITIDEYSGKKMTGKIVTIGKAANSAFSLNGSMWKKGFRLKPRKPLIFM